MRLTADRLILVAMTGTFIAAGLFAGIASYNNIYDLCVTHGGGGISARLTPLSVDVLIVAASLALAWANIRGPDVPWPVRGVLYTAIAATVAGNMLYGLPAGPIGAARSAWPGFAFVATIEILMWLVRELRKLGKPVSGSTAPAADNYASAMASFEATWRAGNPWSVNQLQQQFSLTRAQATEVRKSMDVPAAAAPPPPPTAAAAAGALNGKAGGG